ncbi:hypothetical protein BDW59DRAFT_55691 [Aspergillus cavernicola]|uniref:C2H2-type domain-containing protein n=1 Tax=Aspergillus cavernicola TaxID=176166 RepID=A0ABR4IIF4_9EURO
MYHPSVSFPSSFLPPSSSSGAMPETAPAYSRPSRITPASPFQHGDAGLGISSCEAQPQVSHLIPYPSSEHYTTDWPGHFITSTPPLRYPQNPSHLSPVTLYEHYSGSDTSASPLSYCGPQTMSASSSRGSALDFGTSQDIMGSDTYNFWPNTPGSDVDTRVKEDPDTDYRHSSYSECAKPADVPLYAPIAQSRADGISPWQERWDENGTGAAEVADSDVDFNLPLEPSGPPAEVISKWIGETVATPNSEQRKVPPKAGLECSICGAQFTRRSNCQEHMKRHDPNSRKSYPCEDCGKTLGRKTDLKRHIDSIHRGIRRFGCEKCGHHFSRQDTLARHVADGCRRTVRRSSNPRIGGA